MAAAFDLSYQDLTADQQRLFQRLGLLPGPDIDAYAAAALAGTGLADAHRDLEELYDQHLLTEPAPRPLPAARPAPRARPRPGRRGDPAARDAAAGRLSTSTSTPRWPQAGVSPHHSRRGDTPACQLPLPQAVCCLVILR